MEKTAAIILAAGKGKRMKSKKVNKVALPLGNKPMIQHTVELLKKVGVSHVIVVIGFAKESIVNILGIRDVIYAEQKRRLGTAHAVYSALEKISPSIKHILVVNGDDSAFYKKEIIKQLLKKHYKEKNDCTFLTLEVENPYGLGRVVRDKKGKIIAIIEEKDAQSDVRRLHEINPGCYVFEASFLNKYIKKIKKSRVTGEYYLTQIIDLAIRENKKVNTLQVKNALWRGINTYGELQDAQNLFMRLTQ